MAINFPDSPTLNQEFDSGNITFVWNGTSWDAKRILDGASAYEVAVNNGFVGTEQEWLDSLIAVVSASLPLSYNSGTKDIAIDLSEYDTSSEVTSKISTAISNLVDSAPSSLDTLNELAAALDDDANFATTVTNQIATKEPLLKLENVVTTNYTLAYSDISKVIAVNNSSSAIITVPSNASVAFPVGAIINVYSMTDQLVSVAGASGVTVRNAGTIDGQYSEISLRKRASDEWVASGKIF